MSMIHHEIMRLAELRNGFVTKKQLLQLGLKPHQIARLLKTKFLQSARRGVYRTTTATRAAEEGIVICLGVPHAVLSLNTASEHWGFRRTIRGRLEVLILKGTRAACPKARVAPHHASAREPCRDAERRAPLHNSGPNRSLTSRRSSTPTPCAR